MRSFKYYFFLYGGICFTFVGICAIFSHTHFWTNYYIAQKFSSVFITIFYFLLGASFFKMWGGEKKALAFDPQEILKRSVV